MGILFEALLCSPHILDLWVWFNHSWLTKAITYPHVFVVMQNFDVEIHSVETLQSLQTISSSYINGSATIARVPEGNKFCLEDLAEKLLMVPFNEEQVTPPKRRDEEIQITRRLAMMSSRIYIASNTTLSSIISTPWLLQADSALDANRIEEALAMAEMAAQVMDDVHFDAERLVVLLWRCSFQFHEIAYINQKADRKSVV